MLARSHFLYLPVFIGCLLLGCRTTSGSGVLVTNPQPAGQLYPEVVELITDHANGLNTRCSGTFISEDTVLTAAHCFFDQGGQPVERLVYQSSDGTEYVGKLYPCPDFNWSGSMVDKITSDLGMVHFDKKLAPKIATIAKSQPTKGDPITLVGFGVTDILKESGDGNKNYGHNEVQLVKENILYLAGYAEQSIRDVQHGIDSTSGAGDSGGAVFNSEGKLVAVISAGSKLDSTGPNGETLARTVAVIINHPASEDMLASIRAAIKSKKPLNPGQ